jgi:hypothetical protein
MPVFIMMGSTVPAGISSGRATPEISTMIVATKMDGSDFIPASDLVDATDQSSSAVNWKTHKERGQS